MKAATNSCLSNEDRNILLDIGYLTEDLAQIEKVEKCLECEIFDDETDGMPEKVGYTKARKVMDIKEYLSGLGRASFHETALRYTKDGRMVLFDAHRFFVG